MGNLRDRINQIEERLKEPPEINIIFWLQYTGETKEQAIEQYKKKYKKCSANPIIIKVLSNNKIIPERNESNS